MADLTCLTICNPYPFLIFKRATDQIPFWIRETFGPPGKRVENREWFTKVGGMIYIHAGKSTNWLAGYPRKDFAALMPFMAIVGRATLYDCVRLRLAEGRRLVPHTTRYTPKVYYPELVTDPHASGPYCFLLRDIERIDQPVPVHGKQGFWKLPADALAGRTFERVDE